MTGFVECDTCRMKPVSPVLCDGCQSNRRTIAIMDNQTDMRVKRLGRMADVIRELKSDRDRLIYELRMAKENHFRMEFS